MTYLKTEANTSHIPQIIALAKAIWLPTFSAYFSENELNSLFTGMYNRQKLETLLQNKNYQFWIVENRAHSVGYFATEIYPEFLKLDKIYVSPEMQRQGIGKWIFEDIMSYAQTKGIKQIQLNVNRRNTPAIDFYKNLGFVILKSEDIPGPNGFVYDDYVMTLKL